MNATDEWYEVESLSEHSHRIAEGVIFNSFLVTGTDRALLIDTGAGIGDLRGMVSTLTDRPVTVLVTHAHWDHVGAVAQFEDVRAHPDELTDGRLAPATFGDGGGYGPEQFAADWRDAGRELPDGFDAATFTIEPVPSPGTVDAGETIDLGGRRLELVPVPGHSPGQLGALDREAGVLYGADVVHRDHGLYIHFEGCDVHEYIDTFDRLIDLRDDGAFDTLYIAHDRPLAGDDLTILEAYRDGLEDVLADDLEYDLVNDGTAREYEIAGNHVLTKPDVTGPPAG